MRGASVAGLVLASLTKLATTEDLLFYNDMLYNEYTEATKTLGLTAHIATDAEWRSYTTADFAKYKAIIIPDPNCGSIDKIKFLEDTKAVWSPAVTGNIILIGTDPTYHSSSQSGAIDLIDDSIRFAASDTKGTGLYFSLSCYYDSGDITTIDALSEFGTFYVRGRLACYNDAHLVANAPELKSLDDDSIGNWSCSVHEVFTDFPRLGMEPGTDGFEAFAIALNATGDGEASFADGTSGIPYIIARGAIPVGCGDGEIQASFGEQCDAGRDVNGTPGSPCSTSCKCLYGVSSPGVCKLSNDTTSSSSLAASTLSSSSTVVGNSRSVSADASDECSTDTVFSTSLPSMSANSTLPSSVPTETTTASAGSTDDPATSGGPTSPASPVATTLTSEPSVPAPSSPTSPSSPIVPSNSSVPVGPPPPVTVTASARDPNSSVPNPTASEPSAPDTRPPVTIVTTIDGPTPSIITVIATPNPELSAPSGSSPLSPITIVTTIGGPVPSVITIVADLPTTTHPVSMPPPGTSGVASADAPSSVTSAGSIGDPSGTSSTSPANPVSTTVASVAAPSASGSASSGFGTPPLLSSGSGSATPSFVTVVTSGGGNSNSAIPPTTSAVAGGPSIPSLSTATSVQTVFSTAPFGGNYSVPGSGSGPLSSAGVSAPAGSSGGLTGTSDPTSMTTSVNTISTPGSGASNTPGSSLASADPTAGSSASGSVVSSIGVGSTTAAIPSASETATSLEVSSLSALQSGLPSSATSAAPRASTSGSGLTTSTSTVLSGSLPASNSGASTATGGAGVGGSGPSGTPGPGSDSATSGVSGSLTSSGPGAGASGSSSSSGSGPGTAASTTGSGSLSGNTGPTSLPGNPRVSNPISASASARGSGTESAYSASPTDGPNVSKNGTIFTGLTNSAPSIVPPTTLATATLPAGPGSTCDAYIGIEVIEFIETVEVCPEGATITETITTCVSTMTRPICHTSTPGYPCYPCMGLTPSAGDTATVTRSSCTSSTAATTTITAQTCHVCAAQTYTTTSLPGLTPGGGCKGCAPYTPGEALTLSSATVTATATVRISQAGGACRDCPDAAPTGSARESDVPVVPGVSGTGVGGGGSGGAGGGGGGGAVPTTVAPPVGPAAPTFVPGNPGLPDTSAAGGHGGGGRGSAATTTAAVETPATVPSKSAVPAYVTAAGGPRGLVRELGTGLAAAAVWAVMMV